MTFLSTMDHLLKRTPCHADINDRVIEKAVADRSMQHYVLRLFVAGMSRRSQDAIANVNELCKKYIGGRYELEIVDINQLPLSAREYQILAAPTLIKTLPLPARRFVGDMSNTEKLLAGLDIQIKSTTESRQNRDVDY